MPLCAEERRDKGDVTCKLQKRKHQYLLFVAVYMLAGLKNRPVVAVMRGERESMNDRRGRQRTTSLWEKKKSF